MTTAAPAIESQPQPSDPHASKVAPNDPRLRLGRGAGRTLKKGPAIAIAGGLFTVLLLCLLFAFQPAPAAKPVPLKDEPETATAPAPTTPVLPDTIRNGPETAAAIAAAGPDAGAFAAYHFDAGPAPYRAYAESSNDPHSPAQRHRQRVEQYWKAHNAGILFDIKQVDTPSSDGRTQEAPRAAATGQPSGAAAAPADDDPNLQARKNAFLSGSGAAAQDYATGILQRPRSPYEIKAGTVIPTVLITAINSDLPGPVIGQVRENVYDSVSGNYLLIPQGARLLANYDSMVAWGQERVLVCWNRLIFQDGSSINLQCMPAADLRGAAGLADEVDHHWGRLIQGVAVASLLAATTQSVAGSTQGFNPTLPQMWARNAAGEINNAGQAVTRRNINIQPTITVRPGFSVNVIVNKDLILPPRPTNGFSPVNLTP